MVDKITDPYYRDTAGHLHFFEEYALAALLADDILFCNSRYYSMGKDGKTEGDTIVLFVNVNDTFAPAADAEDIKTSEIGALYDLWLKNKVWVPVKWCALRRKMRPMRCVITRMKEQNAWDTELEALPDNPVNM